MFLNQLFGPRETSEYVRGAVRFRQKTASQVHPQGCKSVVSLKKPDLTKLSEVVKSADSLETLKNKARRERGIDAKARSFWAATEEFSVLPAPAVDKDARQKAIRELLSMGADHFSAGQDDPETKD